MHGLKKLLIPACVLGCLLAGCGIFQEGAPTAPPTTLNPAETREEPDFGDVVIGSDSETVSGEPVSQDSQGKIKLTYRGNESSVKYITSADQLPDYGVLETYDDTYFQTHALILVTESVPSGSIEVSIEAIEKTQEGYGVTLSHDGPQQGQAGTHDMVTWLLWAEVAQGMEGTWTVANPALTPEGEKS